MIKVVGNPYKCYYCSQNECCTKDHFFLHEPKLTMLKEEKWYQPYIFFKF